MNDFQGIGAQGPSWFQAKRKPLIILGVAVLAVLALMVYDFFVAEPREEAERERRVAEIAESLTPREVRYEVDGTAPAASVTMATPTGTEQIDVDVPMMNRGGDEGVVQSFLRGEFVYISAQNQTNWGSVTCRIIVDGNVISENTSSAEYGIATCEGQS